MFARRARGVIERAVRGVALRERTPLDGVATSTTGVAAFARARSTNATSEPLLVTMIGLNRPLNAVHRMIEASGAEIKESRNVKLGGRASNMFLVTNADPMALKKEFEGESYDFFSVFPARNTIQDVKGPYCETSPLLPYVRKATLNVPYKKNVVTEIADYLCSKGVTLSHMDEYRSGRDVVLECIMHLPTGLAEFPAIDDKIILERLESLGVVVTEFGRVEGKPKKSAAA
ncbi:unnamed product [Ostreococcus tauri]|uniref:Unnamed product n=1 Tax=Ostreococcus tauri TaxID=70448 RepID=Q01G16_OSTTA|nr:unnamed product [Ostreococcus tauri]OUS42551.1 hypothetical protein BE221DRAFT_187243 [Ostreococcus tauri]CAL50328.1 unnamed product [Ostreococcus tauri]|eukprot:XP_003074477.1 unnamed product [Ostreococcus tauri]